MNSTARWRLATSGSVTITRDWHRRLACLHSERAFAPARARDLGEIIAWLGAAVEEAPAIAVIREYAKCGAP